MPQLDNFLSVWLNKWQSLSCQLSRLYGIDPCTHLKSIKNGYITHSASACETQKKILFELKTIQILCICIPHLILLPKFISYMRKSLRCASHTGYCQVSSLYESIPFGLFDFFFYFGSVGYQYCCLTWRMGNKTKCLVRTKAHSDPYVYLARALAPIVAVFSATWESSATFIGIVYLPAIVLLKLFIDVGFSNPPYG